MSVAVADNIIELRMAKRAAKKSAKIKINEELIAEQRKQDFLEVQQEILRIRMEIANFQQDNQSIAMADDNLDLTLGKKKKAKKVLILDSDEEAADVPPSGDVVDDDSSELNLGKKKKKTKKVVKLDDEENEENGTTLTGLGLGTSNLIDARGPWPDYTYEEMLGLIPELAGREKKKFSILPPKVQRAGSKKTALVNFIPICAQIKREPKHVLQFLLAELGTTGSMDGTNSLILKGRFQERHFQTVITKYWKEYVQCKTCRESDTEFTKEQSTRLLFLQCKTCQSRCAVAAIKSGFTALVGKRAVARRAAEETAGR